MISTLSLIQKKIFYHLLVSRNAARALHSRALSSTIQSEEMKKRCPAGPKRLSRSHYWILAWAHVFHYSGVSMAHKMLATETIASLSCWFLLFYYYGSTYTLVHVAPASALTYSCKFFIVFFRRNKFSRIHIELIQEQLKLIFYLGRPNTKISVL